MHGKVSIFDANARFGSLECHSPWKSCENAFDKSRFSVVAKGKRSFCRSGLLL